MFANAFTWLGLVILIVIVACYVGVYFMGKKISFGWWMFGALVLGLVIGAAIQLIFGVGSADTLFAFEVANIVKDAYTNLLQLMVMPLVMVAIITGITKIGTGEQAGGKNTGRAVGITIATLLITCAISALISILVTSIFNVSSANLVPDQGVNREPSYLTTTIASIFASKNILAALSENSVLPMIFIAVLFAFIIRGMRTESPEAGAKLEGAIDVIYEFVMGLVDIVIGFAPYGVFAHILNFAANTSFADYATLGIFVLISYVAMIVMFAIHILIVFLMGIGPKRYFRNAGKALMIGFTTRSSMATLPVTIESMRNIGVEDSVASFAGTFGTCVGQNGCGGVYPAMLATMVYNTFAPRYLLTHPTELIMLIIIVTICSLGIAGVGGGATMAGLMVFGVLGPQFNVALIAVLFSVEALIDMGRTALNVSDGIVSGIVAARFSGNMGPERHGAHIEGEGGESAAAAE